MTEQEHALPAPSAATRLNSRVAMAHTSEVSIPPPLSVNIVACAPTLASCKVCKVGLF